MYIPVDWSLKTKVRFISSKPFAWSQKLRTCEEASGITGFVKDSFFTMVGNENACCSVRVMLKSKSCIMSWFCFI
jgi:hypothetical protein